MENRKFNGQTRFFLSNKRNIKYRLIPKNNNLNKTNISYFSINKKSDAKIKNKSYINIFSSKTPKKKNYSKKNINNNLFNPNNSNINNKCIHLNTKSFDYNHKCKIFHHKKQKNNKKHIKNELNELLIKAQFRLFCKIIENKFKNINDIDYILESPHRGVEKINSIPKNNKINILKRTISGYNIKNNNNNRILNPLKNISKKSGISSALLRKVIDYSLKSGINNVSKIINENYVNFPFPSKINNIYLNIPLKKLNFNPKNKSQIINKSKSYNYKKEKEDSIFFDSFIPEDYRITSKNLSGKKTQDDDNFI